MGAVCVSGASGDEDEYCAIRGVLESKYSIVIIPQDPSCSSVKDTVTFEIKQEASNEFGMDKYQIPVGEEKILSNAIGKLSTAIDNFDFKDK